ncbi:MAG TPA: hypothetical protein VNN77_10255 [candidate division Zixibacteria bacterium]|nr:hypothetical protein [candidate division Zixibacteria bacterium]
MVDDGNQDPHLWPGLSGLRGLCGCTEFNSIASGEEMIQAEIERRRRIEEARKKLEEQH